MESRQSCSLTRLQPLPVSSDTSGSVQPVRMSHLVPLPFFPLPCQTMPGFLRTLFSPAHNPHQPLRTADRISPLLCLYVRALGAVFTGAAQTLPTSGSRPFIQRFDSLRVCLLGAGVEGHVPVRVSLACVTYVFICVCVWTHCMSAVQFLQKGVVRAFGEATLFIDKSQHAQLLKGMQTRGTGRVEHSSHDETSYNPIGSHLAASVITMCTGNSVRLHSIFFFF